MVNLVILIGNCGKDPEILTLASGNKVAKVSLATSESYKDKNDEWQSKTQWHQVSAWGKLADILERHGGKGVRLYVEGKITYREHEGKYYTDIIANKIRTLAPKEDSYSNPSPGVDSGGTPAPDGDLPF